VIVVWIETALDHLAGIKQYISQTSRIYAEQVVRRIFDRGKQLEAFFRSRVVRCRRSASRRSGKSSSLRIA
jgi:hypothetical protein